MFNTAASLLAQTHADTKTPHDPRRRGGSGFREEGMRIAGRRNTEKIREKSD